MRSSYGTQLNTSLKLRLAIIGVVLIIMTGTLGFMFIEKMNFLDALYMTVITLSTVGFGEIAPLHPLGRIFVIILILFGVAITGFTISVIGQMILEGQLKEIYGRRKMEHKISKLNNHFIIAGYGRVGRQVSIEFKNKRANFIVIEKDEAVLEEMAKENILFITGEATSDETLRKAGIENANTLISTLPDEAQNVYLTLTARYMNKKLKIIARADYDDGIIKLKRAGADHVVTPHVLGGMRMAMASLRPHVVDFMHSTSLGHGGLSIEETVIPVGCAFAGKSLKDSGLKQDYNLTVIGIKKTDREMSIAPGPNVVLDENDILALIGRDDDLEKLSQRLS